MTGNVGAYRRLSEDRHGDWLAIDRQAQDQERVATDRGLTIARVYEDNDRSAYKRKVVRPGFEQMLVDLDAGLIDGLLVYDLDRLIRQPRDLERLIDIYEGGRRFSFASVLHDIDLSTPDGLFMARIMANVAHKSSADTARRVKRKHQEMAEKGLPAGGPRPFGWQADRVTLDPDEARLLREAVDSILDGGSLRAVVRSWVEQGVTGSLGRQWTPTSLKRTLLSPRLAGFRPRYREIMLDASGEPVRGLWEPVLDEETWDRLVAVLTAPGRSTGPRGRKRLYLLSGLLRCGRCGSQMHGSRNTHGKKVRRTEPRYTCRGTDCSLGVSMPEVDDLVLSLVEAALSREQVAGERPEEAWDREGELAETREMRDDLWRAWRAKVIKGPQVFAQIGDLDSQIEALEAEHRGWQREHERDRVAQEVDASVLREQPVEAQRRQVERFLETVIIQPAAVRGGGFDRSRVEPVPRDRGVRRLAPVR